MEKLDVVNAALAALRAGETCELVVVAGTAGSSPRGVGAWMAVFADGSQAGTIGGGKIELLRWTRRASCWPQGNRVWSATPWAARTPIPA